MPEYLGARKTKDPSRHARGLRVGLCGRPAVRRALLGADAPADNDAAGRHAPSVTQLPESSRRYPPAGAQSDAPAGVRIRMPSQGAYSMRGLALHRTWFPRHGRRAGVRFRPSVSVTPAHTARTPAMRVLHLPGGVRTVSAGVTDTDVRKKHTRAGRARRTHPSSRASQRTRCGRRLTPSRCEPATALSRSCGPSRAGRGAGRTGCRPAPRAGAW
jgi:hypothetical protein